MMKMNEKKGRTRGLSSRFHAIALVVIVAAAAGLLLRPGAPLPKGARADALVIEKARHRLTLLRKGKVLKVYRIALGRNPAGAKRREGDGRTPEGRYRIDWRNAKSKYHLALHISYPDKADRARARKLGVSPGGAIMIHGLPKGLGWIGKLHRMVDWTNGCVAVTDREIEELWRAVPNGTAVTIKP